jgi:hypothetical protein
MGARAGAARAGKTTSRKTRARAKGSTKAHGLKISWTVRRDGSEMDQGDV